jgi:hypothetical protein
MDILMTMDIINEFRASYGKSRVSLWDSVQNDYCWSHSLAMANRGHVYHAEPCYVRGWSEAVGMIHFIDNSEVTLKRLIFDVLGGSESHRNIILDSSHLAVGVVVHNYKMFITIRGR